MTTESSIPPRLQITLGTKPAGTYDLVREVTVLGKLADCDVVLAQNTVSKRHARIVRKPDGYYLEDLKSRNRTFLDGRQVTRPTRLQNGGTIVICDFRLVFSRPTVTVEDDSSSTIIGVLEPTAVDSGRPAVRAEEKLRALMEINRDLAGTLDLADVLSRVLTTLFRIFPNADRGFVLLRDEKTTELVPSAFKTRHGDSGPLTISRTVFDRVIGDGQSVLSEDAPAEFHQAKSLMDAQVRTLMAVPLRDRRRRPVGILQLDTREQPGEFDTDDLDLLSAVADQVGVAVENARLHAVEVRQHALEQESRNARLVQLALLPARKPDLPGYAFWEFYEPARTVGGDYYDYVPLAPATRWAVAVGDVEGKGMAAALLMTRLSTAVRLLLQTEPDPARVVTLLNHQLCDGGNAERFVTFLLVVVDGAAHRLSVVSAGHMGPMVRRGDGRVEAIGEDENGMILAVSEGETYRAVTADLGPGDVVVLYTDGVTDAIDASERLFGANGLKAALAAAPAGAAAAGAAVLDAVRRHSAGCEQGDDITLLCFGRSAAAPGPS